MTKENVCMLYIFKVEIWIRDERKYEVWTGKYISWRDAVHTPEEDSGNFDQIFKEKSGNFDQIFKEESGNFDLILYKKQLEFWSNLKKKKKW